MELWGFNVPKLKRMTAFVDWSESLNSYNNILELPQVHRNSFFATDHDCFPLNSDSLNSGKDFEKILRDELKILAFSKIGFKLSIIINDINVKRRGQVSLKCGSCCILFPLVEEFWRDDEVSTFITKRKLGLFFLELSLKFVCELPQFFCLPFGQSHLLSIWRCVSLDLHI